MRTKSNYHNGQKMLSKQNLKRWFIFVCIISIVSVYANAYAGKQEYIDPLIGADSETTYNKMMIQSAANYTAIQIVGVQGDSEELWPNQNYTGLQKSFETGLADIKENVRPRLLQNAFKSIKKRNFLETFALSNAVLLDGNMMRELDGFWKQRLLILTDDSFQRVSDKKDPIKFYNAILQEQEKYIPAIMQDKKRKSELLENLAQRYSDMGNEWNALALRELRVQTLKGEKESNLLYLDALNQLAMTYIKLEQYEKGRQSAQEVMAAYPAGVNQRTDVLRTRAATLLMRIAAEMEDDQALLRYRMESKISPDYVSEWLNGKKDIPQDGEERLNMQSFIFYLAKEIFLEMENLPKNDIEGREGNAQSGIGAISIGNQLGTFDGPHRVDYYDESLSLPRRIAIFRELLKVQIENCALLGTRLSKSDSHAEALDMFIRCAYWYSSLYNDKDCVETWQALLRLASECRIAGMFPEAKAFLEFGHQRTSDELGSTHSLTTAFEKEQSLLELWKSVPSKYAAIPLGNQIQPEKELETMKESFEEYPLEVRRRTFSWMLPVYKMKLRRLISAGLAQAEEAFRMAEMCKSRLVFEVLSRGGGRIEILTEDEKKCFHQIRRNLFEVAASSYRRPDAFRFHEDWADKNSYEQQYMKAYESYINNFSFSLYTYYSKTKYWMQEYKAFCQEMAAKYPSWESVSANRLLDLDEGLEMMSEETAYINFLQMEPNRILAIVLDKKKGFQAVEYELPWDLSSKCVDYHQLISFPDLLEVQQGKKFLWRLPDQTYQARGAGENPSGGVPATLEEYKQVREALAAELGTALLAPLHPYISESTSHLIISPDNSLVMIPFESLVYQGKPLIASFDISYLQSLSVGKFLKERQALQSRSGEKKLFAIGNPNYERRIIDKKDKEYFPLFDNTVEWSKEWSHMPDVLSLKEWANLKGTETEIAAVAGCFVYHDLLTGKKATKRHLFALNEGERLTQYSHILFAVHGAVMPDCPDYPVLVLGRDDYNVLERSGNGILDVFDVMQLNLNSDLVYLSACETGLGEYVTGEGIFGLPLAFNVAGNRDTVMSLWKIDDEAAAVFSGEFFQRLSEGIPPVKALSAIKRKWLQSPDGKYADPYFWTPMILYGVP